MKFKSLSLIAGAVALTLTTTSFAVKAQKASASPLLLAQAQEQAPRQGKKGAWAELGLTEAQQTRLREIRRNTRTQIEGVLTQEQKDQLRTAAQARRAQRQAGQPGQRLGRGGKGFGNLNLTEDQKNRIQAIKESAKQQMDAVLTPEQRAKIQQFRQNWQQRRQQNR
jgi:Spy/CpxP family protein refolding chaperone